MSFLTHNYRRLLAVPSFRSTNSVYFNGAGADLRLADGAFNLANGGTSFWIRPELIVGANRSLFGTSVNALGPYCFATINQTSGKFVMIARAATTGASEMYIIECDTTLPVIGNYYHFVWIKDGFNHYIYINGVLQSLTFTVDNNRNYWFANVGASARYTFGNFRRNFNGNYFQGWIDEFAISPTIWTLAQVTALYNNGCPGNLVNHSDYANMITWLRMGDGLGDAYPTIVDQIGSNNATMTNMLSSDITTVTPC